MHRHSFTRRGQLFDHSTPVAGVVVLLDDGTTPDSFQELAQLAILIDVAVALEDSGPLRGIIDTSGRVFELRVAMWRLISLMEWDEHVAGGKVVT